MFQHEDGVLLCILQFLEEQKRFFVIAQTPLNAVACPQSWPQIKSRVRGADLLIRNK